MNVPDTKHRILDSAERLFAQKGFHATSLRAITGAAGANVAAVNYHFGSKEALLAAVFDRRLMPLNKERLGMLNRVREEARARGARPGVKDIMRALIEPTILFSNSGAGARNFILLVSRSIFAPNKILKKNFFRLMGPFQRIMLEALKEALPGVSEDLLLQRFHFSVGALAHTMRCCNDADIPMGLNIPAGTAPESLVEELVNFLSAGMRS